MTSTAVLALHSLLAAATLLPPAACDAQAIASAPAADDRWRPTCAWAKFAAIPSDARSAVDRIVLAYYRDNALTETPNSSSARRFAASGSLIASFDDSLFNTSDLVVCTSRRSDPSQLRGLDSFVSSMRKQGQVLVQLTLDRGTGYRCETGCSWKSCSNPCNFDLREPYSVSNALRLDLMSSPAQ